MRSATKTNYIKEVYETIITRDLVQKYSLPVIPESDTLFWEAETWIMAESMKT